MSFISSPVPSLVVGGSIRLTAAIAVNGTATDPSTCVLTLKDPTGSTSTPSPTHDGTGAYHADVTVNVAGTWWYRWSTTAPATAQEGSILVGGSQVI